MADKQKIYSAEQHALIAELTSTYGTDPEDILFFKDDPNPFFGFETSCVMLNRLASPRAIDVEPIDPVSPDSVSHRCQIYFADGTNFSFVGVANRNEQIDGQQVNDQQLAWLASSRALRSVLRISGRNLLKLHQAAKEGATELRFSGVKSPRSVLIAHAHALGDELGLIDGNDKTLWVRLLNKRFKADSMALLNDAEVADWVAYLKGLTAEPTFAAAA